MNLPKIDGSFYEFGFFTQIAISHIIVWREKWQSEKTLTPKNMSTDDAMRDTPDTSFAAEDVQPKSGRPLQVKQLDAVYLLVVSILGTTVSKRMVAGTRISTQTNYINPGYRYRYQNTDR